MGDEHRPGLIEAVGDLVITVAHNQLDYPEDYPWPDSTTLVDSAEGIDDLWVMEATAERLVAAAREVLTEVRRRMSVDIEELGSVRLGDKLYQSKIKYERAIIDGQDKPLLEWLGEDLKDAVNADDVKITAVRAIAKRRNQTPKVIEETFYVYEKQGDELVLTRIPEFRAPKYFAAMEHGERR